MNRFDGYLKVVILLLLISVICSNMVFATIQPITVETKQFQVPVLKGRSHNPLLRIKVVVIGEDNYNLNEFTLGTQGTTFIKDIVEMNVDYFGSDSLWSEKHASEANRFGNTNHPQRELLIKGTAKLRPGVHYFWVTCRLSDQASLLHKIGCQLVQVGFLNKKLKPNPINIIHQRIGVAIRTKMADGIHTSRIPGLAVTNNGTLLAVFDARHQSSRDLQGDIDIGLHRSTDGGQTWKHLQIAMDMEKWGGLPENYNGVSDPCILVDKNSNTIYLAALWMHGVINKQGHWIKGLNENSKDWNHQWNNKGSQPGYGVKQTSQFMIVKSTDDGKTWSKPVNITKMAKMKKWWLLAPAPGNGITLFDSTLVFPCQGRDASGQPFSSIIYSKDKGNTWQTAKRALNQVETTECAVVQLSDSSLMLNMRANKNRGNFGPENGRAVCITMDMGNTWKLHPSSFKALPEPVCMGSLYKHVFKENVKHKNILLFSNPNSKSKRDHLTLKVSFDEGMTWPRSNWTLLDELKSRGYSCITSINENCIGILYESSQADMVFQKIALSDLLKQ